MSRLERRLQDCIKPPMGSACIVIVLFALLYLHELANGVSGLINIIYHTLQIGSIISIRHTIQQVPEVYSIPIYKNQGRYVI